MFLNRVQEKESKLTIFNRENNQILFQENQQKFETCKYLPLNSRNLKKQIQIFKSGIPNQKLVINVVKES